MKAGMAGWWGWVLCVSLLVAPAARAKEPHIPDGHDWIYYLPEHKLKFVEGAFALAREKGMVIRSHPLFYLVALNAYYSDEDYLGVNIGDRTPVTLLTS